MLLLVMGVTVLISLTGISFPASVSFPLAVRLSLGGMYVRIIYTPVSE